MREYSHGSTGVSRVAVEGGIDLERAAIVSHCYQSRVKLVTQLHDNRIPLSASHVYVFVDGRRAGSKQKLSWRGKAEERAKHGGVESSTYCKQTNGVDGQLINLAVSHDGQLF